MPRRYDPTEDEMVLLRKLIEVDQIGIREASAEMGWNFRRTTTQIHRHGLRVRSDYHRKGKSSPRWFEPSEKELATLRHLIEVEEFPYKKAAKVLSWPPKRVLNMVHRYDLKRRATKQVSGIHHPMWRGGRIVDKDGYALLYVPDHPNARKYVKYILEHRLVMERHLGRFLRPEEVVHHRNKNKQDNRIENLALFSENSEHLRHELTGHCPKWTPEGKARIRDGQRVRAANLRTKKARGAAPKP